MVFCCKYELSSKWSWCWSVLFTLYRRSLFNGSVCVCVNKTTAVFFLLLLHFSVRSGMCLLLLWRVSAVALGSLKKIKTQALVSQ